MWYEGIDSVLHCIKYSYTKTFHVAHWKRGGIWATALLRTLITMRSAWLGEENASSYISHTARSSGKLWNLWATFWGELSFFRVAIGTDGLLGENGDYWWAYFFKSYHMTAGLFLRCSYCSTGDASFSKRSLHGHAGQNLIEVLRTYASLCLRTNDWVILLACCLSAGTVAMAASHFGPVSCISPWSQAHTEILSGTLRCILLFEHLLEFKWYAQHLSCRYAESGYKMEITRWRIQEERMRNPCMVLSKIRTAAKRPKCSMPTSWARLKVTWVELMLLAFVWKGFRICDTHICLPSIKLAGKFKLGCASV